MRAVLQRVLEARVETGGTTVASINRGLLILVAVANADSEADIDWLAPRVIRQRIFESGPDGPEQDVMVAGAEVLVVSQFTLLASTRKGTRPSWSRAARPESAIPLYQAFVHRLQEELARPVQTGVFGADMKVHLVNDGPVTLILDSVLRE